MVYFIGSRPILKQLKFYYALELETFYMCRNKKQKLKNKKTFLRIRMLLFTVNPQIPSKTAFW